MIEISGLSKSYGQGAARREVLAGIDLQVAGGELVSGEGISG